MRSEKAELNLRIIIENKADPDESQSTMFVNVSHCETNVNQSFSMPFRMS